MITPKLTCNYLLKKQGTDAPLTAKLTTQDNTPIKNHKITFFINGKLYNRTTNENGLVSLNINLGAGSYPVTVTSVEADNYKEVSKGVLVTVVANKVTPVIEAENLTKVFGTGTPLKSKLLYNGNSLADTPIIFVINGTAYERRTNTNGEASLDINLSPGTYNVLITLPVDDTLIATAKEVTVTVNASTSTPTLTARNVVKSYGDSTPLTANLKINDAPMVNREIQINLNGRTYKRTTDKQGNISLNLNLNPGTYTATLTKPRETYYQEVTTTATIDIDKTHLIVKADDLIKKFKDSTPFKLQVRSYDNKISANRQLTLEINGKQYNRVTDSNGEAKLNINLNPGTYQLKIKVYGDQFHHIYNSTRTVAINKQATRMEGINITKYAKDTAVYQCAVYNELNERVQGKINFKVNGVEYQRQTGSDGLAKLNIRLWTGEYKIQAWFSGDDFYTGSLVTNQITVKPSGGTKTKVEGESVIAMQSKIFVGGHEDATQFQPLTGDLEAMFGQSLLPDGVDFTEYEITETDRRTKTAKFTTPTHFDLTSNFTYVIITSPYHEDFGGVILSVDYDADKDLYTYQCQDWRRRYITKGMSVHDTDTKKYDILETLLVLPFKPRSENVSVPLSDEHRKRYAAALSGLRPLEEYKINLSILKEQNYLDRTAEPFLSYDSVIDRIFNIALSDSNNLDIWFDKWGVCHLDPIDWDYWLNTGLLLTTQDMAEYKYGFDTTNILTGVRVKSADHTTRPFWNDTQYDGGVGKKISDDLAIIFGNNVAVVEGPKTEKQATTTSNNSGGTSSGLMSGKKNIAVGHDGCGSADSSRLNQMIQTLQAKGHNVRSLGIGDNVCQSHGLSSSSKGEICVFICCGICCGTIKDFLDGMTRGYYHYDHAIFVFCRDDIEMNRKQGYAHDWWQGNTGVDTSITRHEMFVQHKDKISYVNINDGYSWEAICQRTANGQFGELSGSPSSSANVTTNNTGETTQPTVDINDPNYIAEQYRLAIEEYSKSVRSLMKFSIKIPLNSPVYKMLHTNTFLFTDLPEKFALVNLPKIYKSLASYKVSRGVPYAKNRWYVEEVKIKQDNKGLFADVTLNAFPSDLSSFNSAMKGYVSAYDSAFRSTSEETTTDGTTNTKAGNIPARTDGKTDCTAAWSLSYVHTGSTGNPLNSKTPNENDYGKIGREGTNYAEFVKGCSSPREVYKKLSNAGWNGTNRWRDFNDESVGSSCVEGIFSQGYANCAGLSKLLKACMDVCGFKCAIAHVDSHYNNVVEVNGKWESCDLCYQSGKYPGYQSAGFNR